MKPDALPDLALGDDKAPVTIVEYASMTCPHCAHFQETTFPELKKRYIDTGKVRYILRDFPLDRSGGRGLRARALRRQGRQDQILFHGRHAVPPAAAVGGEKPIPPLMAIAKQAGFTEASFNACLTNQKAWDAMESVRQRAMKEFKVQSTPTFFVNGTQVTGAVSIEDFAKVIDPYLKGG